MVSNWRSNSAVAGSTFLLWALVAASVVMWGLRLGDSPSVLPPPAAVSVPAPVDPLSVARLLGSSPAQAPSAPALSSRFSLQGVVADGSHGGAALIAIDGKPPKPFRVGAALEEGMVLQSVEPRRALLGPAGGPATLTLELPRPNPGSGAPVPLHGAPGPVGVPPAIGMAPATSVAPATGFPGATGMPTGVGSIPTPAVQPVPQPVQPPGAPR